MKLALVFLTVLTSLSLWFGAQKKPPVICRGKPLSITLLPGPKMTGPLSAASLWRDQAVPETLR
jgi:hypothetical protein